MLTSVTQMLTCRAPVLRPEQRKGVPAKAQRDDGWSRCRRPATPAGRGAPSARVLGRCRAPCGPALRCCRRTRWRCGAPLGRPLCPASSAAVAACRPPRARRVGEWSIGGMDWMILLSSDWNWALGPRMGRRIRSERWAGWYARLLWRTERGIGKPVMSCYFRFFKYIYML